MHFKCEITGLLFFLSTRWPISNKIIQNIVKHRLHVCLLADDALGGEQLDLLGPAGQRLLQDAARHRAQPHPLDQHHVPGLRRPRRLRQLRRHAGHGGHDVSGGVGHGVVVELCPVEEAEQRPRGVLDAVEVDQVADKLLPPVLTIELDNITQTALNLLGGGIKLDQGHVDQSGEKYISIIYNFSLCAGDTVDCYLNITGNCLALCIMAWFLMKWKL